MAFKKDNKVKSNFNKITIGLASPEEILENSFGEVKPNQKRLTIVLINLSATVSSVSASSVLQRTMSVPVESTNVSDIRVLSVTVVV